MSGSNCCFLSCTLVSQERGKVVWFLNENNFELYVIFPLCLNKGKLKYLCSVTIYSLGYIMGVLYDGVQSLLPETFEIIQVNSSTQLSFHFLTSNFPSYTMIYFMQLCAAVFHLLIIRFMLIISFCGSGSCLMLYFFLFFALVLIELWSIY